MLTKELSREYIREVYLQQLRDLLLGQARQDQILVKIIVSRSNKKSRGPKDFSYESQYTHRYRNHMVKESRQEKMVEKGVEDRS